MNLSNENVTERARSATDCVHRGIDRASEAAHSTTESAVASAAKLAERAGRSADKLYAQQEKVRAKTISYANQHPIRAIVVSLGVGFVLAKLFGSRSTSE